ncbi:hypothetical protein [Nitrosopumilus sp.]|uniref:hypothetical protein n=1 Tax=Nitrosopumilus sp. TaxID=2024843 RepID=UPI00247B3E24|nr:hypothetical protein [Nitrosopumilus sp.]MCV0410758.1 hypothetical protein [Nitrosopumilus sp.]
MRQAYTRELDLRAKTDYNSAKKLLEQTDDFGNILFLFQQSYEKILKSVFVYCECVVFNRDFDELLKDKKIKLTHSHTVEAELIQTILPKLLKNYKKTVEILDEKLAKNLTKNKFSIGNLVDLIGYMSIAPKYTELIQFLADIKTVGRKTTNWNFNTTTNEERYQLWLDFLNQIQSDRFEIQKFYEKFNEGYIKYEEKIEKNVNKPNEFKKRVKNATMFLVFAIALAPIALAPNYSRYPIEIARFKNLKLFYKGKKSTLRNGLQSIEQILEFLIQHGDDFNSLILAHKKIQNKSAKWKKRENRIIKKTF